MKTNWENCYKIRLKELTDKQTKHLLVKTLIVQKLLIKYKSVRKGIRIYTEFNIGDNGDKIVDVYFENIKTKEIILYEIQDKITKKWEKQTTNFYNNYEILGFRTDLVIVDLKKLSNHIKDLEKEVKELIL